MAYGGILPIYFCHLSGIPQLESSNTIKPISITDHVTNEWSGAVRFDRRVAFGPARRGPIPSRVSHPNHEQRQEQNITDEARLGHCLVSYRPR